MIAFKLYEQANVFELPDLVAALFDLANGTEHILPEHLRRLWEKHHPDLPHVHQAAGETQ